MAQWSGRGIPPTRKKLHRWRTAQEKARQFERPDGKGDGSRRDNSWNKRVRGAIVNPARFEELRG